MPDIRRWTIYINGEEIERPYSNSPDDTASVYDGLADFAYTVKDDQILITTSEDMSE